MKQVLNDIGLVAFCIWTVAVYILVAVLGVASLFSMYNLEAIAYVAKIVILSGLAIVVTILITSILYEFIANRRNKY